MRGNAPFRSFRVRLLLGGAAVAAVVVSVASGAPVFGLEPAVNFAVHTGPSAIAIADLNGDGQLDLATTNSNSADVSVLLGFGNATFAAAVNYAAHNSPRSVAIGDLNGDARPDLAVANGSGLVSVLLGNGNGTFGAAVNYAAHQGPSSIAIGDLDGDGKPDLVVANIDSVDVSVLLGNGAGGFAAPVNYAAHTSPRSVALGDLNGDGKLDLAVANGDSGEVQVRLGNGNGTFAAAVDYGAHNGASSVAIGDLNLDGKPDLATGNVGLGDVSVLLGNGDGTFASAVNYAAHTGTVSVAIADLNADARPDLATANSTGDVSVLLGSGTGTFAAALNYAAHTLPLAVAIGDLNSDLKPDLVTANFGSNDVSVLKAFSSNANLASLTLSAGTLAPAFSPVTISYNAGAVTASSLTVTARLTDPHSTLHVRVNGGAFTTATSGSASGPLALNVGANTIDVRVTAEDGTTKTYSIAISRTAVDLTPPVITASTRTYDPTGPTGISLTTYGFSVSDNLDPAPSLVCTPALPRTFALGSTTTVNCTAVDSAGNTSAKSVQVIVRGGTSLLDDLDAAIDAATPPLGVVLASTLHLKTMFARMYLVGKTSQACTKLQDFVGRIAQERTDRLPKITAAQAASLTAKANLIRAVLGC